MIGSAMQHRHGIRDMRTNQTYCRIEFCRRQQLYSKALCHATNHNNSNGKQSHNGLPSLDKQLEDFEHPMDAEQFRKLGYKIVDWVADYYNSLESLKRVKPDVKPGYLRPLLPSSPPDHAEPFNDIFADFQNLLMPGVVHWQAPKFFAYFNANSSFPGMLAEMLMSATNMIGFSWASSPVSTELEIVMMDWLAQLTGLPDKFMFSSGGLGGGAIQGTTSEAVLVSCLAARAKALEGRPPEDHAKLVAYHTDQAHSCIQKACMVAGIVHRRVLPTSQAQEYAMDAEALRMAVEADLEAGLIPFWVLATIGTTSTCAVDPIPAVASLGRTYNVWVHVDAAYAGSAAVCPEQRSQWFRGVEDVDSYSFNPHKWLLTNFDCCALWVEDSSYLKKALSLTPVYLQGVGNALDFKDWQIPLGRRWRALKLFFVLRTYGAEQLRAYIRHHIALAQHFSALVQEDARFELAAPARFGLVCFRLKGAPREAQVALLDAINSRGDLFLIHTEISGQYTIRLAIGSATSQLRHVDEAWRVVCSAADAVLQTHKPSVTSPNR